MPIVAAATLPHPPLILPEIGKGEQEKISKTIEGCSQAARFILESTPDTVVVISPHTTLYQDWFHISGGDSASGDFSMFGAGQLTFSVKYDQPLAKEIEEIAQECTLAAGFAGEKNPSLDHGTMVPLAFLQNAGYTGKIVRVGLSGLALTEHYRLGECIAQAAQNLERRVAVLASSDLSHVLLEQGPYGYQPEGPQLDKAVTGMLASGDFGGFFSLPCEMVEKASECGLRALVVMAGTLNGKAVEPSLLSYEGPFGVGYAVATFKGMGPAPGRNFRKQYLEQQKRLSQEKKQVRQGGNPYVEIARVGVEAAVFGWEPSLPAQLAKELEEKAGAFVTLYKNGQLRGCIGTLQPTCPSLAQEILQNGGWAATEDSRFPPVTPEELSQLVIGVDVLGKAEEISGLAQLDPARYGVIVSAGARRGVLLPDLEGVDTAQQQVDIARQKAGILPGEPVLLERFEVVRHHE